MSYVPLAAPARLIIAVFGVIFAAIVFVAFPGEARGSGDLASDRSSDPKATVEGRGGDLAQFKSSREDVHIQYERILTTGPDVELAGVTITSTNRATGAPSW